MARILNLDITGQPRLSTMLEHGAPKAANILTPPRLFVFMLSAGVSLRA